MLNHQEETGHAPADGRLGSGAALYRRPMPGGGYVDLELEVVHEAEETAMRARGRVIMERRSEPGRREGHRAPVVAELTGDDVDEVMADLFRLAQDNAALARGLLRWQSARSHAD